MLYFQDLIARLTDYWAKQGCIVHQGYDLEVGAGTFNPATFLRCLGPEPYRTVYVEPTRRPQDGRYGKNPNRLQHYHQMQVILKPSPVNAQELYIDSLKACGLNLSEHDIRFVEDDWENPTIGASGLGWEIWLDGMEITQFTYFQMIGGIPVKPVSCEITYGLERIAMYLQDVNSFFDIKWNKELTYGDIFLNNEKEWSQYNFEEADVSFWLTQFDAFEKEAKRLIQKSLPRPAYDFIIKASYAFNILEARGVISVTERTGYIARIRTLARGLAECYLKNRETEQFPLLRLVPEAMPKREVAMPKREYNPSEREDFLLEIGSEELPAAFVAKGLNSLKEKVGALLITNGLDFEVIETYGTPRRLSIYVKRLVGGSVAQTSEKRGPAIALAFDVTGDPTQVGIGFFRSLGVAPLSREDIKSGSNKEVTIREVKGTEYLFATVEKPGISTRILLANELPKIILNLSFPKTMHWGDLECEYGRPLRWLVALYGSEEIPFSLANLLSGRHSYGHRQLDNTSFAIPHAKEYLDLLRSHFVMVDIQERKRKILEEINRIEREYQAKVVAQEELLGQVTELVEWPFCEVGKFDSKYLSAPREILISEMVMHQRYFPLSTKEETLLPHFIIVANNRPTDKIREGNSRALSPRLADGCFLFEEDQKMTLEKHREKLAYVTFLKDLGSLKAKSERLMVSVQLLHPFYPEASLEKAKRAAFLCKADLVTQLVGEFPDLQGIAGRFYALKSGESSEVASAIEEHWMPRGENAPLPRSAIGIVLSLAEKMDNLLSCFALGLVPTSSSDPYALRRQAMGMIKILIENKLFLPLGSLFSQMLDLLIKEREASDVAKHHFIAHKEKILPQLLDFLSQRLKSVFVEMSFGKDEIEAVLSSPLEDIYDRYLLISSLNHFRKSHHEEFLKVVAIFYRVKKILMAEKPDLLFGPSISHLGTAFSDKNRFPKVREELFSETTEKRLYQKLQEIKEEFHLNLVDRRNCASRDYAGAFKLFSKLYEPLAALFEEVRIVDDNMALRTNRLALLQEILDLSHELIDFSKIQEHKLT